MQTPPSFQSMGYPMPPPPKRVRFDAIGEAWRFYMADMGQWIAALFIAGMIIVIPFMVIYFATMAAMVHGSYSFGSTQYFEQMRSARIATTLLSIPVNMLGILLTTGLQRRALMQVRGIPADITEMFRLDGMGSHVLLFGLVYVLVPLPLQLYINAVNDFANPFALFQFPGLLVFFGLGLLTACAQLLLCLTPLIIVDQRLAAVPAMKKSLDTFAPHLLPLFGVLFCAALLGAVGIFGCCIGIIFTAPVATVIYGVIYNDFFRPAQPSVEEVPAFYPPPL